MENKELVLNILNYGAKSNSDSDTIPFVQNILNECKKVRRKNPILNIIIVFPKGIYNFYPENSIKKDFYMSNTSDNNPKSCGIYLNNLKNITIEGNGSKFLFNDSMSAFILDNSENITIRNISIDWKRPLGSECKIISVTKKYVDIELDEKKYPYEIKGKKLIFITNRSKSKWRGSMEFDPEHRIIPIGTGEHTLGWNWITYRAQKLNENIVRLKCRFRNRPKVGNFLVMRHHERDHAGIFIQKCKNIILNDINMYSNAGLGILAQYSENLSFGNTNFTPNLVERHFLSGHDDGFQISNCKGQISIENCSFEGLMDDPINCHGTSVKILRVLSKKILKVKFMHHQSVGLMFGEPGDIVGFINHSSMETLGIAKIKKIDYKTKTILEIEFQGEIPENIEVSDALENLTWVPNLLIKNCQILSCRARGILISTPGKVIIENNYFKSSGSAILVAGDANGWYESGAVKDVIIRNNEFSEYCLANLYQFCEAIISIYPIIPKPSYLTPFHRNILIENNKFHVFDYPVIYALSVDNLNIIGNEIKRSSLYQPFHKRKSTFSFDACVNVKIESNKFIGDVLGKNIWTQNMPKTELNIAEDQELVNRNDFNH